jgi:hypothetical protein
MTQVLDYIYIYNATLTQDKERVNMIDEGKKDRIKKFEDLTEKEIAEICNGCGGKGSYVKPPHAVFFNASCNHHDYGYWKGGTEADRKTCDDKFYSEMVKDCKVLPWYKWLRYRPWCYLYYLAVRKWGKKYFYYSNVYADVTMPASANNSAASV